MTSHGFKLGFKPIEAYFVQFFELFVTIYNREIIIDRTLFYQVKTYFDFRYCMKMKEMEFFTFMKGTFTITQWAKF